MGENALNLIFIVLLAVAVLAAFLFFKFGVFNEEASDNEQAHENHYSGDQPLDDIFHEYQHNSYKEWFQWVNCQNEETKTLALEKLVDHLEADPKSWGVITNEVLQAIVNFDNPRIFNVLQEFLTKIKSLWGYYKTIPSFYEQTCKLIVSINPEKSTRVFEDELALIKPFEMGSLEKRKMIIDAVTTMPDSSGASRIILPILLNRKCTPEFRDYTVQSITQLRGLSDKLSIYREFFTASIEQTNVPPSREESRVFQEILKQLRHFLEYDEIFELVIKVALNSCLFDFGHRFLAECVASKEVKLSHEQLSAIHHMPRTKSFEPIVYAIGQRHSLGEQEIEIIKEAIPQVEDKRMTQLLIEDSALPIPDVLLHKYKNLHDTLSSDSSRIKSAAVGLMLTGNSEREKLYMVRAYASDMRQPFIYIDPSRILARKDFDAISTTINNTSKPHLLYIKDMNLLYEETEDVRAMLMHKILNLLNLHAMDKRLSIVGSISHSQHSIQEDEHLQKVFKKITTDFCPAVVEMNLPRDSEKESVFQYIFNKINPELIKDTNLCKNLLIDGVEDSLLDFYFYCLDKIKAMLSVYGSLIPLAECKKALSHYTNNDLNTIITAHKQEVAERKRKEYQERLNLS